MTVAILIASVIAAVAAVGAFVRSWWRDRPRLRLEFRGFSVVDGGVVLYARIENSGTAPIFQVDAYTVAPGISLPREPSLGRHSLQPGEWRDLNVGLIRQWADPPGPGEMQPRLKVRDVGVLAMYGKRRKSVWYSAGLITWRPTTVRGRVAADVNGARSWLRTRLRAARDRPPWATNR